MEHYSTKLIDFKVYVVIVSKLYTTLITVNIPNFYYVNSCYKWFLPPPPVFLYKCPNTPAPNNAAHCPSS